jgi:starch phosphorylase
VTPRRWLAEANPGLAALLDAASGGGWRRELSRLRELAAHADDPRLRERFAAVKRGNKERLARHIERETGVALDPSSLFDVQVKRIHEYKRQLLNLLHVVTRWQQLVAEPDARLVPRSVIFAGKAASSYFMAKQIIRLINDVAAVVNRDARIGGRLKVVFVPNYGVSVAEVVMPGADLSEQISTAGTEASGTGNMKLALNGALTIGTEDGANIEIRDAVGADNIFIFGHTAAGIAELDRGGYQPLRLYESDSRIKRALDAIATGAFSPEEPARYRGLVDALLWGGDHYKLLADYDAYLAAQARVDALYLDRETWTRRAIANVAAMGGFSSDRSIREYAERIWNVAPLPRDE